MDKHIQDKLVLVKDENFNEQDYLAANPDVARAVLAGNIISGWTHFEMFGRKEGRKIRVRTLPQTNFPKGFLKLNNLLSPIIKKWDEYFEEKSLINSPKNIHDDTSELDDTHLERNSILKQYIKAGKGIEIGALHDPVRVPKGVTVSYIDRLSVDNLRQQYPELNPLPLVQVDIIADGERLEPIKELSQDFVIANHFLEHCQNPLLAIENMLRVLKTGGILYMAIPDKRYTFDVARPITPYEHLVKDYTEGPKWSREQHFEEWIRLINKVTDNSEVEKQIKHLMSIDYSIHFHVWTQTEMIELMLNLKRHLEFETELICRSMNEVIFVLSKS